MKSVRVKICGITSIDDAAAAAHAGADAIGLVFYAKSPRSVELAQARAIVQSLPPFVSSVGLFVNAEAQFVESVARECQLDLLQFHGDETTAYCDAFRRPYFKALRMRDALDVNAEVSKYPLARGILLDSYRPGVPGGTGESFDWHRIPENVAKPLILAGGLNPGNVAAAIASCQPWAVDVSGGVEVSPGVKSPAKISAFIEAVRGAADGSTR